ncbi:TetR/AcrR family transcriptional regulator [Herbihabitans rhizosphaerae]|uniref:TetR/AcrR family transcriptional regulator n=1 Tax=Herbihabitans rhizosphaerae TaxID=1872711 RepID=UPI001F5F5F92|nr:TetR/AcrR family transcriptional regulator [Herbihabitans rhizosphaerae]
MTRSAPDRTRAPHLGPERRRPQVLDAALAIAAAEGITAVSIARVADHLGVTRPVVYACFADRIELIKALVEREEQVILGGAFAALSPRDGDPFVAGFQALLTTVAEHPDSWRVVFEGTPDPAVRELFGRGRMLIGAEFERLITPTLRAWGTTDVPRKLPVLVELFLSSCEGAIRTLLSGEQTWTPDELGEFVGKAVHRALREA